MMPSPSSTDMSGTANTLISDRTISIVCAMSPSDEMPTSPDVLVLPEGISDAALTEAIERFPNAVIVAAVEDDKFMRAQLIVGGQNQVDYLKKGCDGRTCGTGKDPDDLPVYEWNDVAIGVIVCLDTQLPAIKAPVLKKLRDSAKPIKLLCIPADMNNFWFPSSGDVPFYEGVYIALCNSNKTYPDLNNRLASFIATPEGKQIRKQSGLESISASVPLHSR